MFHNFALSINSFSDPKSDSIYDLSKSRFGIFVVTYLFYCPNGFPKFDLAIL